METPESSIQGSEVMILEELVGTLVSLGSLLITQVPNISRENLLRYHWLIFEGCPEDDELQQGLIHREYETDEQADLPYYEELSFISLIRVLTKNFQSIGSILPA